MVTSKKVCRALLDMSALCTDLPLQMHLLANAVYVLASSCSPAGSGGHKEVGNSCIALYRGKELMQN